MKKLIVRVYYYLMALKKIFTIKFGPQYPVAHSILKLVLEINGEIVNRADFHISLLYKGTEKLIHESYVQVLLCF